SATARGRRVVFAVYGDGQLLARSRPVSLNEAPAAIQADVRGRQIVELVARSDSAPDAPLPVVWGDARLTD
ncbi:NPCBM/NEW2 domain-containing protein, partial [Paenibacillus polymyxa]|nr:NPCBM/NEW2 domain-containing protein [Paenibacillus polymyxa]